MSLATVARLTPGNDCRWPWSIVQDPPQPPPEAGMSMTAMPGASREQVPPHVLALDDDPQVRELLQVVLPSHDLRVTAVATGEELLHLLESEPVDLLLIDLRLQGEDGLAVARRAREVAPVPVIVVSGRSDEADRVMALELAADDYVPKPFSPRELVARIRAVLRRATAATAATGEAGPRAFRFAGWELNLRRRRLTRPDGMVVDLTNSEFNLLSAFAAAPQRVLSRDQLLERSRMHSLEVYDRAVDVTVLRLRRKLEVDHADPVLIVTERGAGYRFTPAVSVLR